MTAKYSIPSPAQEVLQVGSTKVQTSKQHYSKQTGSTKKEQSYTHP